MHPLARRALLGGLAALAPQTHAQIALFDPIVVTGVREEAPLTMATDPRRPRQPLPAHDGADFLRNIPGFSIIRKGGTDGDPVLRGMAGSRLGILLDGEQVLGACGGRMDPPTAYVFPEAYDRVTVVKGPQSVLHGAGNSAGTVLFERTPARFESPGWRAHASALGGSFGRHDEIVDMAAGTPRVQGRAIATHTASGDYRDGNGERVHSRYDRWSANATFAWTPDERTRIEVTGSRSDGEAAYADRMMDGVAFDRTGGGLRVRREALSELVESVEAHAWLNDVDHVMDNYSLRDVAMGGKPAVSNPTRETRGARAQATLRLRPADRAIVGIDWQAHDHTLRSTMNAIAMPIESRPQLEDARFRQHGLFGEWTHAFGEQLRAVSGARIDRWRAEHAASGGERSDTLASAFARVERELPGPSHWVYAGVGHAERFPDYWELFNREGPDGPSAFAAIRPEKTTQLDVGLMHTADRWNVSVSAFAASIDDYILIESNVRRTAPARTVSIARNVRARTWGLEAAASYSFPAGWRADASLAWVRGENRTDGTPLAQQPPLEARLSIAREAADWSAALLLRAAARQDRVDPFRGNIAGQDLGPAAGYSVVSVNAGWRILPRLTLSAGVDNLLDRAHAEHLSRAGAMVPGYLQTTRVNEPGRTGWIKVQYAMP